MRVRLTVLAEILVRRQILAETDGSAGGAVVRGLPWLCTGSARAEKACDEAHVNRVLTLHNLILPLAHYVASWCKWKFDYNLNFVRGCLIPYP